jgi:mono/diheme cytochrome c family protein
MRSPIVARLTILTGIFTLPAFAFAAGSTTNAGPTAAGGSSYLLRCAACHGRALAGGAGPALKGEQFRAKWGSLEPDALRKFIAQAMPPGGAGRLPPQVYDEITLFIRASNGLKSIGRTQPRPGR